MRAEEVGRDEWPALAGGDGAGRRQGRSRNGSLRDEDLAGVASSDDVEFSGASFSAAAEIEAQKKSPALTVAQARVLIDHALARERLSVEQAVEIVRYRQERNYAAYRSHRKRTLKHHKTWLKKPK